MARFEVYTDDGTVFVGAQSAREAADKAKAAASRQR